MYDKLCQLLILVGLLALSGCVSTGKGLFSDRNSTPLPVPERITVETSAPASKVIKIVQTSPSDEDRRFVVKSAEPMAGTDIKVSVIYFERILFPKGSRLVVTVVGAESEAAEKKIGVGPPYVVNITVPGNAEYPLTLRARLTSLTSQVFSGEVVLTAAPTGEVELLVSPEA